MTWDHRYFIWLGLVVIAGAAWVRFIVGNESWTNWMMAGSGVGLIGLGLAGWLRTRGS